MCLRMKERKKELKIDRRSLTPSSNSFPFSSISNVRSWLETSINSRDRFLIFQHRSSLHCDTSHFLRTVPPPTPLPLNIDIETKFLISSPVLLFGFSFRSYALALARLRTQPIYFFSGDQYKHIRFNFFSFIFLLQFTAEVMSTRSLSSMV